MPGAEGQTTGRHAQQAKDDGDMVPLRTNWSILLHIYLSSLDIVSDRGASSYFYTSINFSRNAK
jgi:hypothetical protein